MSSYSNVRDLALIEGIHLLVNMISQLNEDIISLQDIFSDWQKYNTLGLENQVQLIFKTSADDKPSKYLVHCLTELNKAKMGEFLIREYLLSKTVDCIGAIQLAVQAHGHIFTITQLKVITKALGTSHIAKTKGLPYFDPGDREDGEKKEKKTPYVIEYKGDKKNGQ
ncbi:hypothetical protein LCGC14_1092540 [marine sediment metagenome]|uniref:Uncharacterized protein n=1 Tax=marine sediment metagenome TaxID=412755 RepID=A0A0F9MG95_9ZZZZ